jgi:ABC-type uncharacterized transport system auxiliary subunit
MKRICFLSFLSLASLFLGCSSKPKPNPAIATDVEESFKNRWVAKRMGELQASGAAPDAREARRLAVEEFRKKYEYTSAAKNADPVGGATP